MTFRDTSTEDQRRLREERNADGWGGQSRDYPPGPGGLRYRCSVCDSVFGAPSSAKRHERAYPGCVVRRVDWLDPLYWEWVKTREGVAL